MIIYKNEYGAKTSKEIEVIISKVNNYLYNGSKTPYIVKCNSIKMEKLRYSFESLFTDIDKDGFRITSIDVVEYHFGDLLA